MTFLIQGVLLMVAFFVIASFINRKSGGHLFSCRQKTDQRFHTSKLVSVLMHLDDAQLDELLDLYKKEFGKGPARYARRTYHKWKTGRVQPNSQTYKRFLHHLPHVMSFDLKCEVLRNFMEEYAAKDNYKLDVYTDDWEDKLTPLVRQVVDKAHSVQLPDELERKLKWLTEGDMRSAHELLKASQAAEGELAVSMLKDEFAGIEKLLAEEKLKPRVRHQLQFPYGTIELNIKRR
jgi:hypothetical protein